MLLTDGIDMGGSMMAQLMQQATEQLRIAEAQAQALGLAAPPTTSVEHAALSTPMMQPQAPPMMQPMMQPRQASAAEPVAAASMLHEAEGSALDKELSIIDDEIEHLQQALEAATQQAQTAAAKAG
tara:strand:- start:296 stop:673 length:378 start_codon:yes stop_codon:yes gene_type:complete